MQAQPLQPNLLTIETSFAFELPAVVRRMASCRSCWGLIAIIFIIFENSVTLGLLPEASQEGMLHSFKSYSDVTLFHYNVPQEVSRATWEFAAFMDNPNCHVKNVHIYIQHGSYPVISPNNASFPQSVITSRTSLHHIVTTSSYEPHDATIFPIHNPLPGNWFAVAYIAHWDQQLQQEGLGHKCHYSLGSVAIWSQVMGIPVISPGVPKKVITSDPLSFFKVFIPAGTWHFSLRIFDCTFQLSHASLFQTNESVVFCIKSVAIRARALPAYIANYRVGNISEGGEHTFYVREPFTDGYYYVLVVTESKVEFQMEATTSECHVQALEQSFTKQLTQMTDSFSQLITVRHSNNTVRSDWASTILVRNDSQVQSIGKLNNSSEAEDVEDPCLLIFSLSRIKHAQDFSDTFLLQGREWFTTWVALKDFYPVVLQLEILPFVDIGGTLSINIHLDELLINSSDQIITITACIRKGRVPSRKNKFIVCPPELELKISSMGLTSVDDTKLIPYPEPDMWFIAFQAKCVLNGSIVPCIMEEVMVSIDIRTQPCVFSLKPCGAKGVCQETHKGQYFFTSCTCLGGYSGWGCTDGSDAIPQGYLLLTTLLLTLSNIFFIPAILLAFRRNLPTEALVYLATMMFSIFYHACDQEFYTYCVTKYEVLQFCDFFCSILAFWVTLIAIAGIPARVASSLHMLGVLIIAVGVEYNRTGLLVFIIPLSLGVVVPVATFCVRCCKRRGCICLERSLLVLLLPGIVLATVGLVLFAFIETEANYQYVHSAWHIIIALSLVFLLPKKCSINSKQLNRPYDGTSEAELFDVNGYYSASPVFVVTSDLDNLVPSPPQS